MAYIEQPHEASENKNGCVFCDAAASADDIAKLIVHRGVSAFVLLNKFPYNNGHLLTIYCKSRSSKGSSQTPIILA